MTSCIIFLGTPALNNADAPVARKLRLVFFLQISASEEQQINPGYRSDGYCKCVTIGESYECWRWLN